MHRDFSVSKVTQHTLIQTDSSTSGIQSPLPADIHLHNWAKCQASTFFLAWHSLPVWRCPLCWLYSCCSNGVVYSHKNTPLYTHTFHSTNTHQRKITSTLHEMRFLCSSTEAHVNLHTGRTPPPPPPPPPRFMACFRHQQESSHAERDLTIVPTEHTPGLCCTTQACTGTVTVTCNSFCECSSACTKMQITRT